MPNRNVNAKRGAHICFRSLRDPLYSPIEGVTASWPGRVTNPAILALVCVEETHVESYLDSSQSVRLAAQSPV